MSHGRGQEAAGGKGTIIMRAFWLASASTLLALSAPAFGQADSAAANQAVDEGSQVGDICSRYFAISAGLSSQPVACCTAVPPPR